MVSDVIKPNHKKVKASKASHSAEGGSKVKRHAIDRKESHLTRLSVNMREWYRVFSGYCEGAGDDSTARGRTPVWGGI